MALAPIAWMAALSTPSASVRRELISPFSFVSVDGNLTDFVPGTGAFTIEGFLRFSAGTFYNGTRIFWGQVNSSIWADFNVSGATTQIRFGAFNTSIDASSSFFTSPSSDTWYYWVIQRDALNNLSIYWNGTQVFSGVVTSNYNVTPSPAFALGCGPVQGAGLYWWNDEFRYTANVARYSGSSIAVPTAPFSSSDPDYSNVKALLHFDGANGATTSTDSTGRHTLTFGVNVQLDTSQYVF